MGLMYLFPSGVDDPDHMISTSDSLKLRSYGLPPIFWFYLLAILTVFSFLVLNVWNPLQKMLKIGQGLDVLIAYSLLGLIFLAPIILIGFYFYEKNLIVKKRSLTIIDKVFFIPFRKRTYEISNPSNLFVNHFIDSPNMARIKDEKALKAFQNRGYYELLLNVDKKTILIDRHSNHSALIKLKKILESKALS